MKKLTIMILFIIFCFSFFLLSYFKVRNYEVTYKKDSYEVNERYIKKDKNYVVTINDKKNKYTFIIGEKYSRSRKLVNKINKYKTTNEECLEIKFNKKNILPVCKNNNEFISYYLTTDKMKTKINNKNYEAKLNKSEIEYKNIKINTLNNKKILIWNYHGFYYIDNDKKENIKISNVDVYNPILLGKIDNYLVIPDYDQGYEYNRLKVLNVNNLKITNIELDDSISNESYVLGTNEKSLFIFDKKYEKEYELVPYKLKYRTVSPRIYENKKLVNKSITSLANKEEHFIYDNVYSYIIKDDKLYRKNKYNNNIQLISNLEVKEIVSQMNDEIYYISGDKLYMFSDKYGENIVLEYFELNFNYKNIIYIFN